MHVSWAYSVSYSVGNSWVWILQILIQLLCKLILLTTGSWNPRHFLKPRESLQEVYHNPPKTDRGIDGDCRLSKVKHQSICHNFLNLLRHKIFLSLEKPVGWCWQCLPAVLADMNCLRIIQCARLWWIILHSYLFAPQAFRYIHGRSEIFCESKGYSCAVKIRHNWYVFLQFAGEHPLKPAVWFQ